MKKGSDVILRTPQGMPIKPRNHSQSHILNESRRSDVVFAMGAAGTGKTYIAVALAIAALQARDVKKIIITRPAVEAGEALGFLPGDLREKVDPYLRPVYDALREMLPPEKVEVYIEKGIIEIAPLAYMRGRTLNKAFIILDEAQNCTRGQLKMFLTRLGPNSKTIVTGDPSQTDLPRKEDSALSNVFDILGAVSDIRFVFMDPKDVIRHPLVAKIIEAYSDFEGEGS